MRVRFAQYMVSRGYLDSDTAIGLAVESGSFHELIGAIAMSHRLIDMTQLDHVLSQLTGEKRFGEVAIELGYLTSEQIEAMLQIQEIQEAMEFGEALIVRGIATRAQLMEEMGRFFTQVDSEPREDASATYNPASN